MERQEQIRELNRLLLAELPEYRSQAGTFSPGERGQRRLLRSLVNVRPPRPLDPEFLSLQDEL